MNKIDILLPVFNSIEETIQCIESIRKHTENDKYILHILNDASTDPLVRQSLNEYSGENIVIYHHEKNQGFTKNINFGFKNTKNDVVILNSDTLVSNGWLEGLYLAAYSEEKVAAVNPLSNYGQFSAIPTRFEIFNDQIQYQDVIPFLSQVDYMPKFIEVPCLVGFCMYFKREALQTIGLLDEKSFPRGYGEETDWCARAKKAGYKLVTTSLSYVFHIGGVSFGIEKEKLRQNSTKIIMKKHPDFYKEINLFEKSDNNLKKVRHQMTKRLLEVKPSLYKSYTIVRLQNMKYHLKQKIKSLSMI